MGGPVGGMLGSKLASAAGNAFGLEYEGLSPEDREFEVARRYVRFATHAAKRAAAAQPHLDPNTVAKAAVVEAAKKYAPGLLAPLASLQMMGAQRLGATRPFQRRLSIRSPLRNTAHQFRMSDYLSPARPPTVLLANSNPNLHVPVAAELRVTTVARESGSAAGVTLFCLGCNRI